MDGMCMLKNKSNLKGMKWRNERRPGVVLMGFRKERKSFQCGRIKSREIIKGEETDRAAVFAARLCVNN